MATTFEAPAQYERDLRSVQKERKRTKDSSAKWARGIRPSGGVRVSWTSGEPVWTGGSESQRAKCRPMCKLSEGSNTPKKDQNLVKMRNVWGEMPLGRVRSKLKAQEEIFDASRGDQFSPMSPALSRTLSISDNILYSFDRVDTPGQPLSLDIFVKTTGRETEKLVETEYEVLDVNGEALRGRKARRNLRKTAAGSATAAAGEAETTQEDEGFELV